MAVLGVGGAQKSISFLSMLPSLSVSEPLHYEGDVFDACVEVLEAYVFVGRVNVGPKVAPEWKCNYCEVKRYCWI